jgi:exosortase/archaeosortase family protein
VPTATVQARRSTLARNFALRGVAWSLGLFGLLRVAWFETHAILPITRAQASLALAGFGTPRLPIDVTLACSGADALALCAAAILAYPAAWRLRLAGAAGGTALILALNTIRIGTLGRAAASPHWFAVLHLYLWPGVLVLAIGAYVFAWMHVADRRRPPGAAAVMPAAAAVTAARTTGSTSPVPSLNHRTFIVLTAVFLVLFIAAAPFYLQSAVVLGVAAFMARVAAAGLGVLGLDASASGSVLSTARGTFVVTQECIVTPLIPVYFAAVFASTRGWRRRVPALLAAAPLFVGLGVARLLVVALPAVVLGSPSALIHAFYQLIVAAVVVVWAAFWRHGGGPAAWGRALLGAAAGVVFVVLFAAVHVRALTFVAGGTPVPDPQGAIALLPAFQVGLYLALTVAAFAVFKWRPFVAGLAILAASQVAWFAALAFMVRHTALTPHVRDVRAWALAGPLLIIAAIIAYERPRE